MNLTLKDFVEAPPYSSNNFFYQNYSPFHWSIIPGVGDDVLITLRKRSPLPNDMVQILKNTRFSRYIAHMDSNQICILSNSEGKAVGIDRGEFGGALYWVRENTGDGEEVISGNTLGLIETPNGIASLHGLSHLGMEEGAIVFWNLDGGCLKKQKEIQLSMAPYGHWTDPARNETILLGHKSIAQIDLINGKIVATCLDKQGAFGGYVDCIHKCDSKLYISGRHVITIISGFPEEPSAQRLVYAMEYERIRQFMDANAKWKEYSDFINGGGYDDLITHLDGSPLSVEAVIPYLQNTQGMQQ